MSNPTIEVIGKMNGVVGVHEIDVTSPTVPSGFSYLDKDEIVEDLLTRLSEEDERQLKAMARGELILLHHGFGTTIRNAYGMWHEQNPHTDNNDPAGDTFADQYSFQVIEALYEHVIKPKSPYAAYDAAMKILG
jgi:hypothetical protein